MLSASLGTTRDNTCENMCGCRETHVYAAEYNKDLAFYP